MRIHSNKIAGYDFGQIAQTIPNVDVIGLSVHGSRIRNRAIKFTLSGSGRTGGQWGNSGNAGAAPHKAATWDEWGIFLAALFDVDPDAVVSGVYESAEHFHWVTGDRYKTLTPGGQHLRHNWLSGDAGGRSVGGSYYVQSCKCGAIVRRLASGRTFSTDIVHEFDGVV